jgi:chemotaxis protein MotB
MEETIGVQTHDLQSREERVAELERMLAEKDAQMANMRTSLNSVLHEFDDSELSVREKDGSIYVTMSHQLLFAKGSSTPDANGQDAIRQLAKALVANPDIDIVVEGHTDNTGGVDYNLKLSSDRAVEVAKLLSINGVLPYRITAAGKGMHHPIVPNTDDKGKAMNRRTEVVLSPNLDKLYEMSR